MCIKRGGYDPKRNWRGAERVKIAFGKQCIAHLISRIHMVCEIIGARGGYGKISPATYMVLSVSTGMYVGEPDFPSAEDLIGLPRILATLPSFVSHKFEGALFPVELANGIASMSSYPSASILKRFIDHQAK